MLRPLSCFLRGKRGNATHPTHAGPGAMRLARPAPLRSPLGERKNPSQIRHKSCNYDKRTEASLGVSIM